METNTRKIVARLEREGWRNAGGGKHDKFEHPDKPGALVIVESRPWERRARLQNRRVGSSEQMQ